MRNTALTNTPVPLLDDPPNVPLHLGDVADALETFTVPRFATVAERDARWPTPPDGAHAITLDTNTLWRRQAGAWIDAYVRRAGDRMTGDLIVGTDPADPSRAQGVKIFATGAVTARRTTGGGFMQVLYRGTTGSGAVNEGYIRFMQTQTGPVDVQAGEIRLIGGPGIEVVSGNSDYRIKEEVGPDDDALDRLMQLRPIKFRWKNDPDAGVFEGFLAHELAPWVNGVVGGEKDAMDPDNPERILTQSVNYQTQMIPFLAAAAQQLAARVEALTARVTALEGGTP